MNKITLQGVTVGSVVAAITALFAVLFHKSMPIGLVGFLPVIVGFVGHLFGINFATTRALKKQMAVDQP